MSAIYAAQIQTTLKGIVRRSDSKVTRNGLIGSAEIELNAVDGERIWEVDSYAYRPEGFFGMWQYHVRLTPAAGGQQTRLWAHYERSAWRAPVWHYHGEGWDADRNVREIASLFASDERFTLCGRVVNLAKNTE